MSLVHVDGHVGGGDLFRRELGVLQIISAHPVILAGAGDVLELLAEAAAGEVGPTGAGGADIGNDKAGFVGHGDQSGLAAARVALDGDVVSVDDGIGVEIVHQARGAPGPSAQNAPVFQLARLAVI